MRFSDINYAQAINYHQLKHHRGHRFLIQPHKFEKHGSYAIRCSECEKVIYQWNNDTKDCPHKKDYK